MAAPCCCFNPHGALPSRHSNSVVFHHRTNRQDHRLVRTSAVLVAASLGRLALGSRAKKGRRQGDPAFVAAPPLQAKQAFKLHDYASRLQRPSKPCVAWGCSCGEETATYPYKSSIDYWQWHPAVSELAMWQRQRGALPPKVFRTDDVRHYRTRAKLAVGPPGDHASGCSSTIGLFGKGTWRVFPARDCASHDPTVTAAIDAVQRALEHVGDAVLPFDHAAPRSWTLTGPALRYIEITVERPTGKAMIALVWNGDDGTPSPGVHQLVDSLWPERVCSEHPFWHSIWVHWRTPDPALFRAVHSKNAKAWQQVRPATAFAAEAVEWLDRLPFSFGPASFQQANLSVFEEILRDMKRMLPALAAMPKEDRSVPRDLHLLELHSGVGVIGLSLLHSLCELAELNVHLISTDENPHCARLFRHNADRVMEKARSMGKAVFEPLTATEALKQLASGAGDKVSFDAEVLIMDPPRRGLARRSVRQGLIGGEDEVAAILASGVRGIVYMSCGHQSFMRDAEMLTRQGGRTQVAPFRLAELKCYDMFPFTPHIETLGIFVR